MEILKRVCDSQECPAIVRHEALAVFQTVNIVKDERCKFLEKFLGDEQAIVRETARVSLKVSEHWD